MDAPFVVEERLEEVTISGAFTPRCALWLSPSLGEGGLLRELSSGELHLLLGVLSCLSPNGTFLATAGRVAGLLGLPHRAARQGLESLCERFWQGAPLLRTHVTASGMRFFVPSSHLLETRRSVIAPAPGGGGRVQAPQQQPQTEGPRPLRAEVVARSRALYARPRAEVEAEIEAFLASGRTGRGLAPTSAEATASPATIPREALSPEAHQRLEIAHALTEMGMPDDRAELLLDTYPPERIRRQLEWLPLRQARNPVAYLLSAIERDYAPPSGYQAPNAVANSINADERAQS